MSILTSNKGDYFIEMFNFFIHQIIIQCKMYCNIECTILHALITTYKDIFCRQISKILYWMKSERKSYHWVNQMKHVVKIILIQFLCNLFTLKWLAYLIWISFGWFELSGHSKLLLMVFSLNMTEGATYE